MDIINNVFRYLGYVALSLGLGWFSNLSGDEEDFVLNISRELITLLITILAFYLTIIGLILRELIKYKEKTNKNIKSVLKSIRRDIKIEITIICFAFVCYIIRGALTSIVSDDFLKYVTVASNTITVFSFVYFLLLIYDSVMGLWDLIEVNNKDSDN
ncbi:hypothetical protein [Tannerella forsythia]|uniref:hypothetical protein n=1 Tax=Tannerella forsythia TaxID=28112 RepID=UPI0028E68706|nr:hypothetical protein [Tannerella forsythia]